MLLTRDGANETAWDEKFIRQWWQICPHSDSPRSVRERGWRAAGRPHGARSRPPGASSCPPHPAARFRHCKHPCFPPPSPSRSPPSRRSQRSALHASVGPAAAAQDAGSAKRRAQMAAGPRSSVVRYPLVSCSHCWMTCRLHLTMSLTSRQDFARYKHPVWKRMHGISGKQRCVCRDMAQRARSRCQFLAARPHGVLHWHHHISTVCVDLSSSPEFRENVYESCSAIQCVLIFCSVNTCLPSNTTNQTKGFTRV